MQRIINQKLPTNFNIMNASWDSVSTMLNNGIDMFMIPGYRGVKAVSDVISGMKEALKNKTINADRLNDAVARIIAVKLVMGAAKQITNDVNVEATTVDETSNLLSEPLLLQLTLNSTQMPSNQYTNPSFFSKTPKMLSQSTLQTSNT